MSRAINTSARHRVAIPASWRPTSFWLTVLGPTLGAIAALTVVVVGISLQLNINAVGAMLGLILVGAVLAWIGFEIYRARLRRESVERTAALEAIARKHGLIALTVQLAPAVVESVFGQRSGARVYDGMNSLSGGELSMGTYERSTMPGSNGYFEDWGFLAIRLKRALPNILLESRSPRSQFAETDLIGEPHASQRLSLEGDFDRHFTLYCPKGYERDALYLFTPDLMELLIDESGDLNVQLIDDVAFFYSARPFDLADEAFTERLLHIADVVGAKALRQSAQYRDDRSEIPDVVAEEGRRLSRRIPRWPTLLVWYSAHLLLGVAIAWLVVIIRLGIDPAQWAENSQIPWW